jgi:hypothetical protein
MDFGTVLTAWYFCFLFLLIAKNEEKKTKKGEGTFLKYQSKTCHSLDDYKKKKQLLTNLLN